MKKNRRRGFTIVELVIVIAVIAILAAVLIPTFSNISEKAKKSAAQQAATNGVKAFVSIDDQAELETGSYVYVSDGDGYWYTYDGVLTTATKPTLAAGYTVVTTWAEGVDVYELINGGMTKTSDHEPVPGKNYYSITSTNFASADTYAYVKIDNTLYQIFKATTTGYEDIPKNVSVLEKIVTA